MVAAKETAAKNLTAYSKTSDKQTHTPPPKKKEKKNKKKTQNTGESIFFHHKAIGVLNLLLI